PSAVLAIAPAAAPAALAIVRTLGDVREERHLTGPLHRGRDLHLMAPARTGDAAAADLALLRDVPPELVDVLVVDLGDLVLAEETVPPPDLASGPAGAPALGAAVLGLLSRHLSPRKECRRRLPPGSRRLRRRRPARTGCR